MNRILALDYGRRRIGAAISDAMGLTAQPLDTFDGRDWKTFFLLIQELSTRLGVDRIVLGYPLTMRGEKGTMTREVERFASGLRDKLSIPVILWDERLSSIEAERTLKAMNISPSRNKGKIDKMASVLFLQAYLDLISDESIGLEVP